MTRLVFVWISAINDSHVIDDIVKGTRHQTLYLRREIRNILLKNYIELLITTMEIVLFECLSSISLEKLTFSFASGVFFAADNI